LNREIDCQTAVAFGDRRIEVTTCLALGARQGRDQPRSAGAWES
jgi:hypothetical protein